MICNGFFQLANIFCVCSWIEKVLRWLDSGQSWIRKPPWKQRPPIWNFDYLVLQLTRVGFGMSVDPKLKGTKKHNLQLSFQNLTHLNNYIVLIEQCPDLLHGTSRIRDVCDESSWGIDHPHCVIRFVLVKYVGRLSFGNGHAQQNVNFVSEMGQVIVQ